MCVSLCPSGDAVRLCDSVSVSPLVSVSRCLCSASRCVCVHVCACLSGDFDGPPFH